MIAIFNNQIDAEEYSAMIDAHLTANRQGYDAPDGWSKANKHSTKAEWGVKLPPDLDKLKPIKADHLAKSIRQDEKYAIDWKGEPEQLENTTK